jgi:hypothetical protein
VATTRSEMAALVDAHLSAEDAGDLDGAVAGYTDDVEHDVVGAPGGPLRGPAAARLRYTQLLEQVRTDRLTEARRFYGDEVCVVEHECAATVLGEFAGLPGRGSPGAVPDAARLRVPGRADQPGERLDGHRDGAGAAPVTWGAR